MKQNEFLEAAEKRSLDKLTEDVYMENSKLAEKALSRNRQNADSEKNS